MTIVKFVTIAYAYIMKNTEVIMITYEPFWKTIKTSKESTYTLIKNHNISSATIDKLRKNKPLTTTTLNDLCRIFNCKLEEIAQYIPSENDQTKY